MSRDIVADLFATVRTGKNELVRQNAIDLLNKLASDGDRAARQAVEILERTNTLVDKKGTALQTEG